MTNRDELLQRLKSWDDSAWDELTAHVKQTWKSLRRKYFHLMKEDVEDLVQETILAFYKHLGEIRTETLHGLLSTVAKRKAIDPLRRLQARGHSFNLDEVRTDIIAAFSREVSTTESIIGTNCWIKAFLGCLKRNVTSLKPYTGGRPQRSGGRPSDRVERQKASGCAYWQKR